MLDHTHRNLYAEATLRNGFLKRTGRWRAGIAAFILALTSMGLLSGCGSVSVTDQTAAASNAVAGSVSQRPAQVTGVPNTQETHDLAVAAVDFDPALDVQQILAGKPYTLLVAVENRGNRAEGPFTVTAQLLTRDQQTVLVSARRTLSMLAAGDITVVRFPNDSPPPLQSSYILNARVQPVNRETNTGNNQRVLQIDVNSSN